MWTLIARHFTALVPVISTPARRSGCRREVRALPRVLWQSAALGTGGPTFAHIVNAVGGDASYKQVIGSRPWRLYLKTVAGVPFRALTFIRKNARTKRPAVKKLTGFIDCAPVVVVHQCSHIFAVTLTRRAC